MRTKLTAAFFACLLLVCFHLCVFAPVNAAAAPTYESEIYIADNPDLYPIEYYDSEAKTYKGMLPNLYAKISESTGTKFSYIRAGVKNEQQQLAENKQVDIVSAHIKGEVTGVVDPILLLSFPKDGENIDVIIGFTDIADKSTAALVKERLAAVPDSELLALSLQASADRKNTHTVWWQIVIIPVLIIIIAILSIRVIRVNIKTNKIRQDKIIDPLTGIGNEKYFEQNFYHFISPASITDVENAVNTYNDSGARSKISFAAGFALSAELPGLSRLELLKVADGRMYRNKQQWYATRKDNTV